MKMIKPLVLALLATWTADVFASVQKDVFQLSLEELLTVEVTSVAKKSQRLSDAPAAVYVISGDDIRRAGAQNLPEALRLAPGVQVARIDGSRYSVSIRGFSGRFNSKLLVLVDGRTVYTSLFSGVYWEVQDLLLDDVERIEVIRGPGGTLWGANAVNGVINVITKRARDTQGGLVEAHGGTIERGGALRYGVKLGEVGHLRTYAKVSDNDNLRASAGGEAHDAWARQQAGFRMDLAPGARDAVTLQGDAYQGRAKQTVGVSRLTPAGTSFVPDTADNSGANLLFRWQRTLNESNEWQLQAYFDHVAQQDAVLDQRINTADVEFQHRFALDKSHDITWGLGYRQISDDLRGGFTVSVAPERRTTRVTSLFAQDEIKLREDLRLTLGSKFEHNDYSGLEIQPNARLLWQASATDTWWGAISRAVRTPSRFDHDGRLNFLVIPGVPARVFSSAPSPDFDAERLVATEIGYRGQFGPRLNVDATVFHNRYSKLRSRGATTVSAPSFLLFSQTSVNDLSGSVVGYELAANWQATPAWRLRSSYSHLQMNLHVNGTSTDTTTVRSVEGNAPRHLAQLHSLHTLGKDMDLAATVYYVSKLPTSNLKAQLRFDLRLAWRPARDVELSLVGQNLLDPGHVEYLPEDVRASVIPRSILAQLRWGF